MAKKRNTPRREANLAAPSVPAPAQRGVKDKFYFSMVGLMAALGGAVLYLRAMTHYPPANQQTATAYQSFLIFWLVIVARFTYSFVWAPSSQDTTAQWQPGGIEFPGTTRKLDADGEPSARAAAQFKGQ
ncbi:hypothetical protein WJX84_007389 [Apatococcus fuscideae]|uniref:Uncharacterized protein n=1 Tax=Apatococcus fuscideae TaxID=2026836 RepID=A0AAW1TC59_9CHLO